MGYVCVLLMLLHCVITIVDVGVGRRRRKGENTHLVMLVLLLRGPSTAHLLVVMVAAAAVVGGRRGRRFASLTSMPAIPSSIARSITNSQRSARCGSNNASWSINSRRTSARSAATWPFTPEWTTHREATVAVILIVSPLLVTAPTANANFLQK